MAELLLVKCGGLIGLKPPYHGSTRLAGLGRLVVLIPPWLLVEMLLGSSVLDESLLPLDVHEPNCTTDRQSDNTIFTYSA